MVSKVDNLSVVIGYQNRTGKRDLKCVNGGRYDMHLSLLSLLSLSSQLPFSQLLLVFGREQAPLPPGTA